MTHVIRLAQPTDAPQLAELHERCNRRRMANRRAQRTHHASSTPPALRHGLTLVYEQDGTLLGFVTAVCMPMLLLAGHDRTTWNIVELCLPDEKDTTEVNVGAVLLQEINHKAQAHDSTVSVLW